MCLNTVRHVASIERHKARGLGVLSYSSGRKERLEWGCLLVCVKDCIKYCCTKVLSAQNSLYSRYKFELF